MGPHECSYKGTDHIHEINFTLKEVDNSPKFITEDSPTFRVEDDGFGNSWELRYARGKGEIKGYTCNCNAKRDNPDDPEEWPHLRITMNTMNPAISWLKFYVTADQNVTADVHWTFKRIEYEGSFPRETGLSIPGNVPDCEDCEWLDKFTGECSDSSEDEEVFHPTNFSIIDFRNDKNLDFTVRVMIHKDAMTTCQEERKKSVFGRTQRYIREVDLLKFSDVTLHCQGQEFSFIKLVLASQSEVFEAMFTHDTKGRRTSSVEIKDVAADTVKALLEFIRNGTIHAEKTDMAELLILADRYLVEDLRYTCYAFIQHSLDASNFMDWLELAKTLYDKNMQTMLMDAGMKVQDIPLSLLVNGHWQAILDPLIL